MWFWWLGDNLSNSAVTVLFICNTLNIIFCLFILEEIFRSEIKCRKEKKSKISEVKK